MNYISNFFDDIIECSTTDVYSMKINEKNFFINKYFFFPTLVIYFTIETIRSIKNKTINLYQIFFNTLIFLTISNYTGSFVYDCGDTISYYYSLIYN